MNWLDLYNKEESFRIEKEFYKQLRDYFATTLKYKIDIYRQIYHVNKVLILCIGTNKIGCFFDNYGPLVGSFLNEYKLPKYMECYGTMEKPLHALNICDFLNEKESLLLDSVTIVIDACVVKKSKIGTIEIHQGAMMLGAGIGKLLPVIGDISIYGFTAVHKKNFLKLSEEERSKYTLSNEQVELLSHFTSDSIAHAFRLSKRK